MKYEFFFCVQKLSPVLFLIIFRDYNTKFTMKDTNGKE